jgi:hypothetical protein
VTGEGNREVGLLFLLGAGFLWCSQLQALLLECSMRTRTLHMHNKDVCFRKSTNKSALCMPHSFSQLPLCNPTL